MTEYEYVTVWTCPVFGCKKELKAFKHNGVLEYNQHGLNISIGMHYQYKHNPNSRFRQYVERKRKEKVLGVRV